MSDVRQGEPMEVMAALRVDGGGSWLDTAEAWQVADVEALFDRSGRPNHFWTRARGGRKTTDAAGGLVAMHLTQAPPGATSYVVASDAAQAGLVLDSVRGFVLRSPELRTVMRVEARRVVFHRGGERLSSIDVLPADEAGAFGLRPWVVVADELAVWPPGARGLWAAVVSALPKVAGSRLLVSTSAGSPDHWSYLVLEQARGSERWRTSETPGPLRWIPAEVLAEQQSLLLPSQYARLHLNVWQTAEDRLSTREDVLACVTHPAEPLEAVRGRQYVVTCDAGLVNDRTVAVVAHREAERTVIDRIRVWSGSKGRPVQLGEVQAWIRMAHRTYNRAPVVADPWQMQATMQTLAAAGVPAKPFVFSSQSVGRLAASLYRALRDRRLGIPDDRDLIDELCAARLRETAPGLFRLDHASGSHDDRVVATAIAVHYFDDRPAGIATVTNPGGRDLPRATITRTGGDSTLGGGSGRGGLKPGPLPRQSRQARILRAQGITHLGGYRPPEDR